MLSVYKEKHVELPLEVELAKEKKVSSVIEERHDSNILAHSFSESSYKLNLAKRVLPLAVVNAFRNIYSDILVPVDILYA